MSRLDDVRRFYDLFDRLEARVGGRRTLARLGDRRDWPARGVYFFFEPDEVRSDSGAGARVVRVGTHALTDCAGSTLRQRLGQHRGRTSGGGNHRGSIFRLLLGSALLARGDLAPCASWGVKGDKRQAAAALIQGRDALGQAEVPVERAVSDYIGQMPLLWLDVPDDPGPQSLRGLIERNAIALLSNHQRAAADPPSPEWLGSHCDRPLVRSSGLWNQRHVDESHEPEFLNRLGALIGTL